MEAEEAQWETGLLFGQKGGQVVPLESVDGLPLGRKREDE